jgi:4-amino-4-deoxy-L-arabinose transferase-like glycosyltransferase
LLTATRALTTVFLAALLVRVLFVLPMPADSLRTPISSDFTVDARAYVDIARALEEHGHFGYGVRKTAFRPPLYPVMLAAVFSVAGESFLLVRLLQALLGALACAALYGLGRLLFGVRGGLLAGLALAVYPFALYFTGEMMTETLFLTLTVSSAYATVRVLRGGSWRWAIAAGLLWGLATLCRPMAVGYVGVIGLLGLLGFALPRLRVLRPLAGAALLALLLLVPWSVRNSLLFERPVFLTTYTGHNLYKGLPGKDNVTAIEDVGYNKTIIEDPDVEVLPADEATLDERSLAFFKRALADDPGAWIAEKLRGVRRLWFDFNLGGRLASLAGLALGVAGAFYLGALVLAAFAAVDLARRRAFLALLVPLGMIAVTAFMYFPFFSGKRFRIPTIDPYLLLLAAWPLSRLLGHLPDALLAWLPGDDGEPASSPLER